MIAQGFADAFRIQGRVLLALMLREARTRYGRQRIGYLWALAEPIAHIGVFYVIFVARIRFVPLGDSIILFLATGFATYIGFQHVMSRTQGGYGSNAALLSYPPVRVMDVFLGRALLELATWMAVTFIIFGGLILVGHSPLPSSTMTMLWAILALFAIGFGVGTVLGIVSEFYPTIGNVVRVPLRLLYFASGIFYLPESMPPFLRDILVWNPILHGITLFRMGYYQGYLSHIFDGRYLFVWAVASVLAALVAERIARKRLRSLI